MVNMVPILILALVALAYGQDCFCVEELDAAQGLLSPTVLENAGDGSGRMFFGEQQGLVWILEKDEQGDWQRLPEPYLNLTEIVFVGNGYSERGFLSMSFHPDYEDNGLVYLYYFVQKSENVYSTLLTEVSVSSDNPNKVAPETERVILDIDQPFSNHNGGQIFWAGDYDGSDPEGRTYLYVSLGDGGLAGDPLDNALNTSNPLGNIFRIDPLSRTGELPYGIPQDNPFVGDSAFLPEIYTYGLRNPWRVSVDRPTGRTFIADVGQNAWEEVNIMETGANFGWAAYEANVCYKSELCGIIDPSNLVFPIFAYEHSDGARSLAIIGGFVYRGCNSPGFEGKYFAGAWMMGIMFELTDNGDGTWDDRRIATCSDCAERNPAWSSDYWGYIQTFGVDEDGELYFASKEGRDTDEPAHAYRLIEPETYVEVC